MKIFRWIILLPAAVVTALVASSIASFFLSLAHGFTYVHHLLVEAIDMAGRPVDGTIVLLLYRGLMGAASTYAVMVIAPSRKLMATYCWFALLAVGCVALVALMISLASTQPISIGTGYRKAVEVIGLLAGSLGVIISLRRGEL